MFGIVYLLRVKLLVWRRIQLSVVIVMSVPCAVARLRIGVLLTYSVALRALSQVQQRSVLNLYNCKSWQSSCGSIIVGNIGRWSSSRR